MAKFSRFLAGGIVGAGLALLFSPKSGREIRNLLKGAGRKALPPSEEYQQPSFAAGGPAPDWETAAAESEAIAPSESLPAETEKAGIEEVPAAAAAPVESVTEAWAQPEETARMFPAEAAEEAEGEMMIPGEEEQPVYESGEIDFEEGWESLKTPAEGEPIMEPEPFAKTSDFQEPESIEESFSEEQVLMGPVEAGPAGGGESDTGFEAGAILEQPEAELAESENAYTPAPARLDPDEMRRRIDETRNRLKAKALENAGGEAGKSE